MEIFDFSHFFTIKGLDPAALFALFGQKIIKLGNFRNFFFRKSTMENLNFNTSFAVKVLYPATNFARFGLKLRNLREF